MRQGKWEYLGDQIIPCCFSHPFNPFDPTSKDALQFSIGNAIENHSDRFTKADFIGDLPPDQRVLNFPKRTEVRWRDIRGLGWRREPLQRDVPTRFWAILELWVGAFSMCTLSFLCPALHPAGKNLSTKGTKSLSMNHGALKKILGGSIVATCNLWWFHKTVRMLFWRQQSCFRLQACVHLALFMFYLRHVGSKISLPPPWRDAVNYHARVCGVWQLTANILLNEPVSAHGESNGKYSECSRPATCAC
jgi:hypothetical protein